MERHHFETELQALKNRLLKMGALVEERVHRAVQSLIEPRLEEARRIIASDKEINDLQIEIDDRCLKLLALQQPHGVGPPPDHVGDEDQRRPRARSATRPSTSPRTCCELLPHPPLKPLIDIPRMAEIAEKHGARRARRLRQAATPSSRATCCGATTRWTQLKDQVFRVLLTYMMADPGTIERALALILISRNLERIADHATNIAEDVIFMVEAKDVRHHAEETAGKP